ncbi:MAG: thioredoxin family protein [Lactobacillus sp.]|uniref:Thioredoxin n=1 Tax=Bombilactobacillus bombi TaxID=1303590 RepID=A0A347SQG4_9LACO|nr:thioredoxin family protein [Bombilactobacillus bombi]AXX64273.1 thioredoxin [Bombilactobacillus bombi]MCO6543107.1 thioredoxin family protein [Lactobacillus sp.]RHW48393.1 thioredoxin [Bombilactobacillus bombi]RHW49571.1 thioredoxin [Bombilactobacillus bombi]
MKKLADYQTTNVQELTKNGKFMLFFEADWCPDCKFIEPLMPEIEAEYPEYQFIEVDRDEYMDLAKELGIMGIPSFVAFADGKEIGRFVNKDRKTKQEVETFINSLN